MYFTGLAKKMREKHLRNSYPQTMRPYEQTLDQLVQNDPKVTNPDQAIQRYSNQFM
jgi:hypothetical protein